MLDVRCSMLDVSLAHLTMLSATVVFSGRQWLSLAAVVMVVELALLLWNYRAAPRGGLRWLCAALKTIGLCALAFCLLEPLWSGQRAKPGANLFAVIVDNSAGLQIKDRGETRTRGELLRELVNPQNAKWLGTLQDTFEVRDYYFDARLQTTRDFSELNFEGRASAIGSALRTIAERYQGRHLAGVLLLTDGNATDIRGTPDLAGLPPVYPVVIGRSDPIKDIAVQQTRTTQTDFEDAPVSVQADVSATGYRGESVVAELTDVSGKQVAEQTLKARKDQDLLAFRFQLKPEKSGLSFYRVNVRAKYEPDAANAAAQSPEATLANNDDVVVVDRGRGPYRILYVAGRPFWEFKFMNRAIQEDDQLQLVSLIRIANREPKFNFLGRAGETSNPLFRGFGNQSAVDVEQYDKPVLVRMNTKDEFELRGGFPKTPEELYAYHAIILDHIEAEFFTPEQATLLQKFVSERGGGFMMMGGMESFQQGRFQRTPIGDMLPVYLDRAPEHAMTNTLRLDLTREGWLQPWARLRDNEADEKNRLRDMPTFGTFNPIREVKPGASAIATGTDPKGTSYPALVVQRFGRGHTAALMIADLYLWGMRDAESHRDMDKTWRQLMRWLVNDVPSRVELVAQPQPNDPNDAVSLQVRVRDPKFQPLDNATISLEVQQVMNESGAAGSNTLRLQAEPSASEPGLYQATFVPRVSGGYKVTVGVTNAEGEEVGHAAAGWSTDLAEEEFRSLSPNVSLLESIARKTGGEIVAADKLNQFALSLPRREAPVMEPWTSPLWHTPAMFAFALACFLAEWGLRRWRGMP